MDQGVGASNNSPVIVAGPTEPRLVVLANRLDVPDFSCALPGLTVPQLESSGMPASGSSGSQKWGSRRRVSVPPAGHQGNSARSYARGGR